MFNLNIICEGDNHYFIWSGNSTMDTCPPNQKCTCGKCTFREYEDLLNYPKYKCPICSCDSVRKLVRNDNDTWSSLPYCPICKMSFIDLEDENMHDLSSCRPYVHSNE